jgi:hypothetical protein
MSENQIFELVKDIAGEGEATHKALDELTTKIKERLRGYCKGMNLDWGKIEGEEEPTYAEFILECDGKTYVLEIGIYHQIRASVDLVRSDEPED